MTEIYVSKEDLQDLSKKLDKFGATLNERQRAVLLAMLALASPTQERSHAHDLSNANEAESIAVRPYWGETELPPQLKFAVPDDLKLASLSDAFQGAFHPGTPAHFDIPGKGRFTPLGILSPPSPECICKAPEDAE